MSNIQYPRDDKFDSALACAMSHPSFLEGLEWLVVWEHEREVKARDRAAGAPYDNLFGYVIRQFAKEWNEKHPGTLDGIYYVSKTA